jgi:uncharacterized membrane protein YdjX (TVP38/TMEM64 family)
MKKLTRGNVIALAAFPLLLAAVVVPVIVWHSEIWSIFASGQRLREWIAGWGPAAPLVFIGVQIVQVVIFAIPGEVTQVAGGYLFGGWMGLLLSVVGISIGSTIAFFLARLLGRPFVDAVIPARQLERVEKFLGSQRTKIVFFLLFLIPGIPKDILCYVAGVSPLRFPFFILASTLGRLPGIVGSVLIGGAVRSDRWIMLAIVSAVALGLFIAGLILRPRLEIWVQRIADRKQPPKES